ncbi:MAG: DUF86 domain-containing protein [Armatimonadetes bacterium]|nr:DUF86 domain-containing protein [Armatimonadota bacterium]
MPKRDPPIFIRHMPDYAREGIDLAARRSREDLDEDRQLRYALTHVIALIGEAATLVPQEHCEQYPGIPWRQIVGMRHKLIHGSATIELDVVRSTVQQNLPALVTQLEDALGTEPDA